MKHLLYILILLGFISGTSNAASFSVECPIYALHLENRNEIFDINSKLSISERFYGQSKINFKNGIITKIIEHDLGAGFTNARENTDHENFKIRIFSGIAKTPKSWSFRD